MNQYQQLYQAPPYCHYDFQGQHYVPPQHQSMTQIPKNTNDEYSRKRGMENIVSPQGLYQQGEKKQRNASPDVFYDLDTGSLRTEQRLDPVNNMILSRLDGLSNQLKSTVKSDEIKELATKEDLKVLSERISAQESRLDEVVQDNLKQKSEIEALRVQVLELGQITADRKEPGDVCQQSRHIDSVPAASGGNSPKRMNLVVEGIPEVDDLYVYLIELASFLNIFLYKRDLTLATRLRRRDRNDKRPGPVLFCFVYAHIRDNFLKCKRDLKGSEKYSDIWIKADEPLETRRLKAEFRRIAYRARSKGESVYFNHAMIQIGDDIYYAKDLNSIPDEFKSTTEILPPRMLPDNRNEAPITKDTNVPKDQRPQADRGRRPLLTMRRPSVLIRQRSPTTYSNGQATRSQMSSDNVEGAAKPAPLSWNQKPPIPPQKKISETEKIRRTDHGICFSGSTAYPSNLYKCDVVEDDITYRTNEHGYFFNKANVYKRPDLAKAVLEEKDQYKLKDLFFGLGENPEWNRIRAPTLRRLFRKKMEQHPELEERLLSTAPHRLIEASVDPKWGGGAPFTSKKYDEGTFEGANEFGDIATEYRDKKLAELRRHKVTQK